MRFPTPTEPVLPVLAIMPPGAEARTIQRLLSDEDVQTTIRDPAQGPDVWTNAESYRTVVIDESLEPAAIAEALAEGWISRSAPVFVVARRLPARERYMAWLEAGAWDILKIPLEGMALALRLRNILRGQHSTETHRPLRRRYDRADLLRVVDETLSLTHRHERDLHCVAVAVEAPGSGWPRSLLERLADAAHRLVRRSDLIGAGDGLLFILLPDTDTRGARTFADRLQLFLQDRLDSWGLFGTVRTGLADGRKHGTGRELLGGAARSV
ncbi:MAG: hypothetical protein ACOCVZ_07105 [Gemmatimonadota bacterium]